MSRYKDFSALELGGRIPVAGLMLGGRTAPRESAQVSRAGAPCALEEPRPRSIAG